MDFMFKLVLQTTLDRKLTAIAERHVPQLEGRGSLEQRFSDSKDFFETSVWALKDMLKEAYDLGQVDRGFTTIEMLQKHVSPVNGVVMRYGDRVFVSDVIPEGGYCAYVYRFVGEPKPNGQDHEQRLSLEAVADETFPDSGHAIAWCFAQE
jgi:hypothetical protein